MFAKKVLISLALVAVMPSALSRHVRTWEDRLFPDDLVRSFPPANIEDLHISQGDVIPAVEPQPDFVEDDTQGQNQDIFDTEVVPNFDDTVNKVRSIYVPPEIEDVDFSENNANNQNDYPNQEDVIVPVETLNVREREPVIITIPDEQSQDYPEYNDDTENKNQEVQTWDNDGDSNDIPQAVASSHKGWIPW